MPLSLPCDERLLGHWPLLYPIFSFLNLLLSIIFVLVLMVWLLRQGLNSWVQEILLSQLLSLWDCLLCTDVFCPFKPELA